MSQIESTVAKTSVLKHRFKFLLAVAIWIFGLAQCGQEDSLSSKVKISMIPDSPVVLNTKLVLNPGTTHERIITPPWFMWGSLVENNSPKNLVLVTYEMTATGNNKGAITEKKLTLDPNGTCGQSGFNRAVIAVIPPSEAYTDLDYSPSAPYKCDPTLINTDEVEAAYIDGLPASSDLVYSIDVKGVGWFTDGDDVPIERFESSDFLITQ